MIIRIILVQDSVVSFLVLILSVKTKGKVHGKVQLILDFLETRFPKRQERNGGIGKKKFINTMTFLSIFLWKITLVLILTVGSIILLWPLHMGL